MENSWLYAYGRVFVSVYIYIKRYFQMVELNH